MKNFLKHIFINLFLLLLFFSIADYLVFLHYCSPKYRKERNISYSYFYKNNPFGTSRCLNRENYFFRKPEQKNGNKKSIVLFGCSYTYGDGLSEEETFSHQLYKSTKGYDVYNYGISGGGVQHMSYFIKDIKILEEVKNPPEYVFYTYIPSHIDRVRYYYFTENTSNFIGITAKFDSYKNIVLEKNVLLPKPLYKTFIMKLIFDLRSKYEKINEVKYINDNKEIIYQLLIQSKQIINKKFPKTKFVILVYDDETDNSFLYDMNAYFKQLSQNGFIVIYVDDLIGKEQKDKERLADNIHPNARAWRLIVPELIEKLNLQKY